MAAMAGKLRLVSALCALVTAGVVVAQTNPVTPTGGDNVEPGAALPQGGVEDPAGERPYQARVLGQGDELVGRHDRFRDPEAA